MTRPNRRLLPALAIALGVLGAGALVAAAVVPRATTAAPEPTAAESGPTPRPVPSIGAAPEADASAPDAGSTPIAELADPAWVTRTASAGGIPERALAAYAGAALRLAETRPGCGIGWNTLAAIGLVESEHGAL